MVLIGESGTQMIMRTFHTGGAVKFITKDVVKDFSDNDPFVNLATIRSHIKQDNDVLMCNDNCKITIDLTNYTIGKDIIIDEAEQKISSKNLIAKIEFDDVMFNLILDYPIELLLNNNIKITPKESIELTYQKMLSL